VAATLLTRRYIAIVERAMDVDTKVEAVLQEASEIAYDIIEEAKAECQSIAEEISADEEFAASFVSHTDDLGDLVTEIVPIGDHLSATIFDLRTDTAHKPIIRFSTSTSRALESPRARGSEGTENAPYAMISNLKQNRAPASHQEGGTVYGIAPILEGDSLIGAVVVHQKLGQELVRNIIDLQNLLSIYALRPELERLMIWIGVIALVMVLAVGGAVLAAILARSVTKPIMSLVAGTREVGKGNLDYRVEPKGKDEIAMLIDSFNSMTAQLKASREKLLMAERLAAWRDVARRIAHEIKNPLTPIQLSMYRLRKNLGNERYNQIFEQSYTSITNEVENLRNMVTEFSQFARMPKPRTRPASPNEIVQDAINLYKGLPNNVVIQTELADDLPQIMADRDQMRQVLHNLIGNAVDAMSDGGQLSVTTRLEADSAVSIEVSDTGCGMSDEVRQKIFTPYFTTKETGTGLGMAITAQIIEEHGGEISVDSKEGAGTRVIVKLKAADGEAIAESET
jgi:nitrogen fixation/metabolism regulation signal transduction histidine kinase